MITARGIGRAMRNARLERHVNLFELARRLRVHATTIKNWERGTRWPSIPSLDRYARAIGSDARDFL